MRMERQPRTDERSLLPGLLVCIRIELQIGQHC